MKKMALLCCMLISSLFSQPLTCFYQQVTLINRTGGLLNLAILDKPLRRSDVPHLNLRQLDHYEKISMGANARIVGWYQPGEPTDYTILTPKDHTIIFIKHDGIIKTLHGSLRDFTLENPYGYNVIAQTKNPNVGDRDCKDCAASCQSSRSCPCLDTCWDKTQDLTWHLDAYEQRSAQVASGTQIGIYEAENYQPEVIRAKRTTTTYYDL